MMNTPTFLDIVAKDLYAKTNGQLSDMTLVFPNKRAALFFNKALTELTDKPMWSPCYTTISELFRQYSDVEAGDKIKLVCDLHVSYTKITGIDEPLDKFYGWGEVMLSDFDDIDKHLADAQKVFSLLGNIHELDGVEYLTESQQDALRQFFSNFSKEHNTELKRRFLQLWNKFYDIYTDYNNRLKAQGIAYEGMLYRDVIENKIKKSAEETHDDDRQTYVFVGFNLLHDVEIELFSFFQKRGRAKFYWDFDAYYMRGHEAGKYISQHLKYFPNELDNTNPVYNNFGKQDEIAFISSPTEDLQARYITQWLTPERIAAGRRTAIVLADEGLLETVLHCLPPAVKSVNITTGYPLEKSPISSLVRLTAALLQRKSYTLHTVNAILRHPFAKYISDKAAELHDRLNKDCLFYPTLSDLAVDENMRQLFSPLGSHSDSKELNERMLWMTSEIARHIPDDDDFSREALFRMYTVLNRLKDLIQPGWTVQLYQKLLQQIIQTTTIPFHGEPIEGIQIMGVLETRNLDFDHLLLLSCNEGKLPARINDSSFIPHSVRLGYGLTTIDNKVAIYSYYFHRLLQRTRDAHILYNSSTDSGHTGEMSRFMLQLIAESNINIRRKALSAKQESVIFHPQEKVKTADIVNKIINNGYFSPSALGTYLRCPLKFFYKYVTGIKDNDTGDEEGMDARVFGNIFHKSAETLYAPFINRSVTADYINGLLREKGNITLQRIVDQAFRSELFMMKDDLRPMPRLNGLQVINREMVITFLRHLLEFDRKHAPFTILATEHTVEDFVEIDVDGETRKIKIGGNIDRLDAYTGADGVRRIRVIDYKTGKKDKTINMPLVEDIFDSENIKKHADYYLQALMYSGIVSKRYSQPVSPNLLYVQQAKQEDYSPVLTINKQPILDVKEYKEEYDGNVKSMIANILDKDIPFSPTDDRNRCKGCIYAAFCC
nr:hypothetical protein Prevot99_1180 [uncultured Prevotella sp.]